MGDYGLAGGAKLYTDAAAALGICGRRGLGRVRHLDCGMLWVQQRVRNNDLDLYYVPGDRNPIDIFTKPNIPPARMDSLLELMGCTFAEGRPASAPTLRTEGGTKAFSLEHPRIRFPQRGFRRGCLPTGGPEIGG